MLLLPALGPGVAAVITEENTTEDGTPRLRVYVFGLPPTLDPDLIYVDPAARWSDEDWLVGQITATIQDQA